MSQASAPLHPTNEAKGLISLIPIKEPLRTILLWAIAGLHYVGAAVGFTYVPTKNDLTVTHHEIVNGLDNPDKR